MTPLSETSFASLLLSSSSLSLCDLNSNLSALCSHSLVLGVWFLGIFPEFSEGVVCVCLCGIRLSGVSASGAEAHVCVRRGSSVTLPHGTQTDTTLVLSQNRKWHGVSQNVLIPVGRVSLLEGNEPMVTHTCPGSCKYHIIQHMISDRTICSSLFGQKLCANTDVNAW